VSYADPIVLHETTRRQVLLVRFFIKRSFGSDIALRIVTYRKARPPFQWNKMEARSLSLPEDAARRLLGCLKEHFAVAEGDEDGSYIVVRLSDGEAQLSSHDPAAVASALTKLLSQKDIVKHLRDTEVTEELAEALRGAIRLREMRSAVAQLEAQLDSGVTDEKVYQRWCREHAWAFGNAYVMPDDVREISPGDHLDLLLPTIISGYRDIVELKRPDMQVLLYDDSHRNHYFSAEVSRAIGQCHRYMDVFAEEAAHGLRDHPEILAYHPRATIVIGRSIDWQLPQWKALHGLNSRLVGITVMTYDQLLAQGERLVEMLASQPSPDGGEEMPLGTADLHENPWGDEVPF
jgi:hypothetical protein